MHTYRIFFLGSFVDYDAPDTPTAIEMFVADGHDQDTIDDVHILGKVEE